MSPFDVMTSGFDVVSNSRSIFITSEGFKMFRFYVVESTLSFPYIDFGTILAIGLVDNIRSLGTIQSIFIWKKKNLSCGCSEKQP